MDGFKEQVAKALRILDELEKGGDVTIDTSATDRRLKVEKSKEVPPMLMKRRIDNPPKPITQRHRPEPLPPRMAAKAQQQPQPAPQAAERITTAGTYDLPSPFSRGGSAFSREQRTAAQDRLKGLTPHQRVALQAGVDLNALPAGVNLTGMKFDEMQALAERQTRERVAANSSAQMVWAPSLDSPFHPRNRSAK